MIDTGEHSRSPAVYVDHDPIVLAHAHDLLKSTPEGATAYVHGDLREPESLLKQAAETLDLAEPVAVLLFALLHLVPDEDEPYEVVRQFMDALQPGSFLAMSHMASDIRVEEMAALAKAVPKSATYRFAMRSYAEVARFFDGLELVEPGVVPINEWRAPGASPDSRDLRTHHYGGVGRRLTA